MRIVDSLDLLARPGSTRGDRSSEAQVSEGFLGSGFDASHAGQPQGRTRKRPEAASGNAIDNPLGSAVLRGLFSNDYTEIEVIDPSGDSQYLQGNTMTPLFSADRRVRSAVPADAQAIAALYREVYSLKRGLVPGEGYPFHCRESPSR